MPRALPALRRRRPYLWASAAALFLGGVTGQPSATKLLTIPCTLVVPGNQQRTAPVYGLTECYHATVCIDQPVASDVISPPPAVLPPSPAPAPGGGRTKYNDPAASEAESDAEDATIKDEFFTEDKEDIGTWLMITCPPRLVILSLLKTYHLLPPSLASPLLTVEAPDNEPIPVNEMPGLEPGMGTAWSVGFGTHHMRRLRGESGGEKRRLNEADVGSLYGYKEEGYDDKEAASSDEWDFRRQRFEGPEDGVGRDLGGSGGGNDGGSGGSAGYVGQATQEGGLHTKAAGTEVAMADRLTELEGAEDVNPIDVPEGQPPGTGEGGGPGAGDNPIEPAPPTSPSPPNFVPPKKPDPTTPAAVAQPVAPPQDTYVGGVGEIAMVRVCSREVVCQECGPVNVVPRCTCSMVLYDPLTDPDYFLK